MKPKIETANLKTIMQESLDHQEHEKMENEHRESNIILYRVDESNKENAKERIEDDILFFRDMCSSALGVEDIKITKAIRLGKKVPVKDDENAMDQYSTQPRPLKIVLDTKEEKSGVFSNLRKLKNADEKYKKISVT